MFGKAFKTRSYYVFNYTPRYYDERKERLEKIKEKYANSENKNTADDEVVSIKFSKNDLRKAWAKNKSYGSDKKVMMRLAVIITLIVGLIAYTFDLHSLF